MPLRLRKKTHDLQIPIFQAKIYILSAKKNKKKKFANREKEKNRSNIMKKDY